MTVQLPQIDTCDGCGVCCFHMGYPAFLYDLPDQPDEPHWLTLPEGLRQELLAFIDQYELPPDGALEGPCLWLDAETRRCKHHVYRPKVCRDFKAGSHECRQWREHYRDQLRKR